MSKGSESSCDIVLILKRLMLPYNHYMLFLLLRSVLSIETALELP